MEDHHDQDFLDRAAAARERINEIPAQGFLGSNEQYRVVLDVRETAEFDQAHLPGAVNLPLGRLNEHASAALPDKDAPIACYCNGGNRGALATEALQQMGYRNVVNIDGGLHAIERQKGQ
ncbi:rhodanese-like domain-containing protein [Nesterenkonia flava]|uniref:Rhodanese-like domain-containing protein n=1 Tax=Nesterenkonia flava TaxID=469799 RepID=A0ABU1FXE1_9MICC|nr:rhodanese-like domain-containing protein [Nesterenkonia flava]MDR5713012.1 rhodanese-like domain-containing protein [Nesterenkonia flava]